MEPRGQFPRIDKNRTESEKNKNYHKGISSNRIDVSDTVEIIVQKYPSENDKKTLRMR